MRMTMAAQSISDTTDSEKSDFTGEAWWTEEGLHVSGEGPAGPYAWSPGNAPLALVVGEFHASAAHRVQVLLQYANQDPAAILQQLRGSFAIALFQPESGEVLLATDPFGIQPLYYAWDGQRLIFATRLAQVKQLSATPWSLNPEAIYHYLNFAYIPGPDTIYQGVRVLPPGTIAACHSGKVHLRSYWDMRYPADLQASEEDLAVRLREEIEQAVRLSVPDDVASSELGAFLSGGTDSGVIAGLLSSHHPSLNAYSVGFSEAEYNELYYASLLAQRFGLRHHTHTLTVDEVLTSIPLLVQGCDQPFGNSSLVATWRCTQLAADTNRQLLFAGDGGDEIFGGNERYRKDRWYVQYQRLPQWMRHVLWTGVSSLPGQHHILQRVRNMIYRGNLSHSERWYSEDALASRRWGDLLTTDFRQQVAQDASLAVVRYYDECAAGAEIRDRFLYVDLKTAIWGNDLPKVMTAARLTGVRVRFPYLDPVLATFTGRLDPAYKIRGLTKRYLFKRAVADVLPPKVLHKPKHGFGVPIAHWLRIDRRMREAILDPVLDSQSALRTWVTGAGLQRLVDEHLQGEWDHGDWLWALMMLERWLHHNRIAA